MGKSSKTERGASKGLDEMMQSPEFHVSRLANFFYLLSFSPEMVSPLTSPRRFLTHPIVLYVVGTFSAMVAGVAIPSLDLLSGYWTNGLTEGGADSSSIRDISVKAAWLVTVVGAVAFVLSWSFLTSFSMASDELSQRMRKVYIYSTLSQDTSYFDSHGAGEISTRASKDIETVRTSFGEKLGYVVWAGSTVVSAICIAFSRDAILAGVLFSTIPFTFIVFGVLGWLNELADEPVNRLQDHTSSYLEQVLSSVRLIQSFGIESSIVKRLDESLLRPLERSRLVKSLVRSLEMSSVYFVLIVSYGVAIWWGSRQIVERGLGVGTVVTVFWNFINSIFSFSIVVPHLASLLESLSVLRQIRDSIEREPLIDVRDPKGITFSPRKEEGDGFPDNGSSSSAQGSSLPMSLFEPSLELVDVTFAYPSRPNVASLSNVTVKAHAGKVTALVGASGSGKSTIASLLIREYDPTTSNLINGVRAEGKKGDLESQSGKKKNKKERAEVAGEDKDEAEEPFGSKGLVMGSGEVRLSGRNLKEYNLRWLRSQVATVQQHPQIFTASIFENVAAGLDGTAWEYRPDLDGSAERVGIIREMAREALEKAQALDFVEKLPLGMDTIVSGGSGSLLSGGQKQRLAIARALIRKPKILCLDEATSALDSSTEAKIQEVLELEQRERGMTVIVIAHRLSTVRNADQIIVMERGKVVEMGDHDFLVNESKNGTYRGFVNRHSNQEEAERDDQNGLISEFASTYADGMSEYSDLREKSTRHLGASADMDRQVGRPIAASLNLPIVRRDSNQTSHVASINLRQLRLQSHSPKMVGEVAPSSPPIPQSREESGEGRLDRGRDSSPLKVFTSVYLRGQSLYFALGFFGAICNGAILVIVAWMIGRGIETLSIQGDDRRLRTQADQWALYYFILALSSVLVVTLNSYLLEAASEKMATRIKLDGLKALLRQEIGFFDKKENRSGGLSSALDSHPSNVAAATGLVTNQIVISLGNLLGSVILALSLSWKVSLPLLAPISALLFSGWLNVVMLDKYEEKVRKPAQDAAAYISEVVTAIRTVMALGRERQVMRVFEKETRPADGRFRILLLGGVGFAMAQATLYWMTALIFYWGGTRFAKGEIGIKQLYSALEGMIIAGLAAGRIFTYGQDLARATSSFKSFAYWLSREPEVATSSPPEAKGSLAVQPFGEKDIVLSGVEMFYPERKEKAAITGLNLHIKQGQSVAFCGTSGGGKSTILSLLERFYEPSQGSIAYGGKDIRDIPIREWRSKIGLVSQDPVLYNGSIRWNIALGALDPESVTMEEIESVCREACILDFIRSLPQGFETDIGLRGGRLSGGQKQRICIARALLRKPDILLLDEATSALDPESEVQVQKALDMASRGRTTITVAHRLSTIRDADLICVVHEGRIVEKGSHSALVSNKGMYFDLVRAQL
ncbi:P-loop containing nucleoside triphosphate hydrolase protein [Violaceomyces palustris]|uniref:P-loop containing nucleoside triphosphate hydrolase protein n=1 Tax=Violaceomyces palustris TaxID=1673888 RepID=A0ACD0NQ27_9BASI|nr:P-loop containing nucleoside triphosphate hydrolase protein [Violaceomyces palustris]